jgi:hypothetical protein
LILLGLVDLAVYTAKKFGFMYYQKKELRGHSTNFHIHVTVSDLYIPTFGPAVEKADRSGEYKIAHRNMNV